MSQGVILDEGGVKVTDTHFEVPGASYPLREIESVARDRVPPASTGPILMIVCGILCLLAVTGNSPFVGAVVGVGLLAGAAGWWMKKKPAFTVCLRTASGEVTPIESQDEQFVGRVAAALEAARSDAGPEGRALGESPE
jgi:hypothetical protein